MGNNSLNQEQVHLYEPKIWRFLSWTIIIGILIIFIVSTKALVIYTGATSNLYENLRWYFSSLAMALLIGGACFNIGGLLGFLFGIPRILNSSTLPENLRIKKQISQNDNLVQISDWVTKIIVGVGLTQFYQIPSALKRLGEEIAPIFNNNNTQDLSASGQGISIVLYFLVVGFLCSYLWTRIHFSKMLAQNQNEIDEYEQKLYEKEQELAEKEQDIVNKETALVKTKNDIQAITTSFSNPLLDLKSKQIENLSNDDPNKNKFGGKAEGNDRIIIATITTTSYDMELFTVSIELKSTNIKNPLSGTATFYLHPTFNPHIRDVKIIKGIAKLYFVAYGAFTVGVVADDGITKLEIDLATIENAPQLFKSR